MKGFGLPQLAGVESTVKSRNNTLSYQETEQSPLHWATPGHPDVS